LKEILGITQENLLSLLSPGLYTHTHTYTHTHIHTHIHTYMYIHTHTYTHTHIHTHIYIHTCIYTHTHIPATNKHICTMVILLTMNIRRIVKAQCSFLHSGLTHNNAERNFDQKLSVHKN
jgi:hypothetical protein